MKRRSDIRKLISKAREVWRQSENYQAVKKKCRDRMRSGWFFCECCLEPTEAIKVDHIVPIGKEPQTLEDFGWWLPKLFCPVTNLQGLRNDCHKLKTKEDKKKMKEKIND